MKVLGLVVTVEVASCSAIRYVSNVVVAYLFSALQLKVDTVVMSQEKTHPSCEVLSLFLIFVDPVACITNILTQRILVTLNRKDIFVEAFQLSAYFLHRQSVGVEIDVSTPIWEGKHGSTDPETKVWLPIQ